MFDSGGKVAAIDALIKKQPFWVVSKINEWFHLDWGARAIPNNAIRMERDRIVKKHPFRYLIYRLFRALKELKKAIFSKT